MIALDGQFDQDRALRLIQRQRIQYRQERAHRRDLEERLEVAERRLRDAAVLERRLRDRIACLERMQVVA